MVQSIERAFAVLETVAGRPAGVTAIADDLRLPKSTVARLLATLEQVGAVERFDGARWRLGEGLASLAASVSFERSVTILARPHLIELVGLVGEDAGLGVPDGYDLHYLDQVDSDQPVQVRDWTGTRAPMHAVPSGLVLLATWPEEALAAYLARGLERLTPSTVVEPAALRARLASIRQRGYAWGREEFAEGINSVAAAVRDGRDRPVAAIHVHGPAYRFPADGREDWIAARVRDAAAALSVRLAHVT